jgi:hypothetical protein
MITPKRLFVITMATSILFGILLPLAFGIKDTKLIAIILSGFRFVYAVLMLVMTFLLRPNLRIKVSRQNGVSIVRYELKN